MLSLLLRVSIACVEISVFLLATTSPVLLRTFEVSDVEVGTPVDDAGAALEVDETPLDPTRAVDDTC